MFHCCCGNGASYILACDDDIVKFDQQTKLTKRAFTMTAVRQFLHRDVISCVIFGSSCQDLESSDQILL